MASTLNAFDALLGSDNVLNAKSKKKSKPKKKPTPAEVPAASGAAAPVAAATAGVQKVAIHQQQDVDLAEACAIVEQSARSNASGSARVAAWKDWSKQAKEHGPRALRYVDADGSVLDFKQMVLRSRALELALESCLISPLSDGQEADLAQLLATFLPGAPADQVAVAVAHLGALLATDPQAYDTTGIAQRAVQGVVAALKAQAVAGGGRAAPGGVLGAWTGRLAEVDRQMAKHGSSLDAVVQQAGQVAKPHMDAARQLVALHAEKLDLIMSPGRLAGGGASSDAAARSLMDLQGAISSQLQAAMAREQAGGKGSAPGPSPAQAVAALKREDAALAQQAADVAGQIRALEQQLAALRGQAADVADRRERTAQRLRAAQQAAGGGGRGGAQAQVPASHYQEELAAAQQLAGVVDPMASLGAEANETVMNVRASNQDAAVHYQQSVRALLSMGLTAMEELPQKLAVARQRRERAEKLAALASSAGKADSGPAKQAAEATRLVEEVVSFGRQVAQACAEARDGVAARFAALARELPPNQASPLQPALQELDHMAAAVAHRFAAAMDAAGGGMAVAPAPAPTFNAAPGPRQPAAAAPVPAQPAAAPVGKPQANGRAGAPAAASAPAVAAGDGFMQVRKKGNRPLA